MRKNPTETIDGFEITISQLPAMLALRTLNRIARAIAPAVGHVEMLAPGSLANQDVAALGKMASALFGQLGDEEVEGLARVLLQGALVKEGGKSARLLDVMDELFVGKTFTLLKVLVFAFRANYGDFSDALRGLAPRAGQELTPAPVSNSTPS